MRSITTLFLCAMMLIVCIPAVSSAAQTLDVSTEDFFFQPSDLTISAGDTVRWTNPTFTPHTTTSGSSNCVHNTTGVVWDSGTLSNGQSFSVTFDQAGVYPYFCSFHCGIGMTGTITVTAPTTGLPVPAEQAAFEVPTIATPVLSTDPAQAQPIGVGDVAVGGPNLSMSVAIDQYTAPVDIYFLLYFPAIDPANFYEFTSGGLLQPLSAGLEPWKLASDTQVSEDLFGSIPVSVLPPGTYFLALLVTPAGDQSLAKYDLWITLFSVTAPQ
jgi:plastocyanin